MTELAIDPQIAQMLAAMPEWPGVRHVPLDILRQSVRESSIAFPPAADAIISRTEERGVPRAGGEIPVRLYWPEAEGPLPITVYMHGGGYVVGDLDTQDMIARALCAWAESIVVSVDYRLAPEHPFPAGLEDAFAAFRWAAEHGTELGGDPDRLALAGDSAGGNFACAIALMVSEEGGPQARAVINIYGPCNCPEAETPSALEFADGPLLTQDDVSWFWEQYLSDPAQAEDYRASPVRAASHAGLPPHFVATAECDPSRDDAELFAAKLVDAGVTVEMKRYPGMVHGFASWVGFLPGAREALKDAAAFLKAHCAA